MLSDKDATTGRPSPDDPPRTPSGTTSKGTSMRPRPHRWAFRTRAWILRNIVADDPHPVPSSLDRWDHQGAQAPVSSARQQRSATGDGSRIRIPQT